MSICHPENPPKDFFALIPIQSTHVKIKTSLSLSYLASALLVCPSALKGKPKSVSKTSLKLGSGVLRHFTFGKHQKAKNLHLTQNIHDRPPILQIKLITALGRATYTPLGLSTA